jgi:hypothetical protein
VVCNVVSASSQAEEYKEAYVLSVLFNIPKQVVTLGGLTLIIGQLFLIIGCGGRAAPADSINSAVSAFATLKEQNRMPGLSPSDHGEVSAFVVDESLMRSKGIGDWPKEADGCAKPILVKVSIGGRQIHYFFCTTENPPKLLASQELINGQWRDIKPRANQ